MFRIVRDARGALVHVRTESGACIGCVEVGLYEVIRRVIEDEQRRRCARKVGPPCSAVADSILTREQGDAR